MLTKCTTAVQTASTNAGRGKVSQTKLDEIEKALIDKRKAIATGKDRAQWLALTDSERSHTAMTAVMEDIKAAADRKVANAERQIVAQVQTRNRLDLIKGATKGGTTIDAYMRDMTNSDLYVRSIANEMSSNLRDMMVSAGDAQGAGLGRRVAMAVADVENPEMTKAIIKEIYAGADGNTGNKTAQVAAKTWLDTIEAARTRFNKAGGDVGKLDYGYIPRSWNVSKIRKAGADGFAEAMMPHVNRSRYVDDQGNYLDDDAMRDFLRKAWETLSTEGINKMNPGDYRGAGKRANRGAESRTIHLRDGDAELAIMQEFGRGSVYEGMIGHTEGLSRSIGLIERYGPDATATHKLMLAEIEKEAGRSISEQSAGLKFDPRTRWRLINGEVGMPDSETAATVGQTMRNFQTFGKLGGAVISSLTDLGTIAVTAGYNRMSFFDVLKNAGKHMSDADTRTWMEIQGFVAESSLRSLDRFSADFLGNNWSGKLAGATMKLSLMNRWTDGMRQGFTMSLSAKMADMVKKPWAELDSFDQKRFNRAGITEQDWTTLQTVTPDMYQGRAMLTPASVAEVDAQLSNRIAGLIMDESEFAVVNPDLGARAVQSMGGLQAGTWGGEIARTVMQFKSFPVTMMTRHWARMMELEGGGRLAYGGALLATSTALGAMVVQIKEMLAGKDPIDMDKPKFWARAFSQGGGASIIGDMLTQDTTADRGKLDTLGRMAFGPTFGSIADAYELTKGNIDEVIAGKDTHAGAEAIRFARAHTPVAGVWWIKPVVERSFLHGIQEQMSPGYLARMKQRAKKEWDQEYWWAPGASAPTRGPFGE